MSYSLTQTRLNHRYEVLEVLSAGAFAKTYIAQDIQQPELSRCVVKYYQSNPDYPNLHKNSRRVFTTEADTLKTLGSHPQIPGFIDSFEENQGFFLVQEYIEGHPLSQELAWLCCGGAEEREAKVILLLRDVLEILDFIHAQGIIHCDLKPNNILRRMKDGKLVLIDFGAVQPIRSTETPRKIISTVPLKSTIAVSPSGYLAAEQLIGKPYPCSDIYALGIIALQMLTGLDPGKLQLNLETSELNWQDWETGLPDYSESLIAIVSKMIRYDYKERYQSAREVLAVLKPLIYQARTTVMQSSTYWEHPPEHQEVASLFTEDGKGELEDWNEIADEYLVMMRQAKPRSPSSPQDEEYIIDPGVSPTPAVNPSMMTLLARMGILVAILNAFAIALGIYTLVDGRATEPGEERLAKAKEALDQGNIDSAIAIAQSISPDSPLYQYSQTAVKQWQQDWSVASLHYNAAQKAFEQQDWQNVLTHAARIPDIAHWQNKVAPLVQEAQYKAESQAHKLLQTAFRHAEQKNFTQALNYLQQISPQTQIGQKLQPKLEEYSKKQQIRAMYLLQQAYNRAQEHQFDSAIALLQQIPPNTPAGTIAQDKLHEYNQKQKNRNQSLGLNFHHRTPLPTKPTSDTLAQLNPGVQLQEIS